MICHSGLRAGIQSGCLKTLFQPPCIPKLPFRPPFTKGERGRFEAGGHPQNPRQEESLHLFSDSLTKGCVFLPPIWIPTGVYPVLDTGRE